MVKRTVTTVEKADLEDAASDAAEDPSAEAPPPLFDSTAADGCAFVTVYRLQPLEEQGYLGRVPPDSTEADLLARWGGGEFDCRACNSAGRIITKRRIPLAGDPKFAGRAARRAWEERMGVTPDAPDAAVMLAPPGGGSADIVTILQAQMQAVRDERREREQESRDREERLRTEQRERDERRERDDRERDERRSRESEEQRERDRQHMATMLQLVTSQKTEGDPMGVFLKGVEFARTLTGGGGGGRDDDEDEEDEDPVKTAIKELARGFLAGRRTQPPARRPAAANPAATVASAAPAEKAVKLTGTTAEKMDRFVALAKKKGADPSKVLEDTLDVLTGELDGTDDPDDDGPDEDDVEDFDMEDVETTPAPKAKAPKKKPAPRAKARPAKANGVKSKGAAHPADVDRTIKDKPAAST